MRKKSKKMEAERTSNYGGKMSSADFKNFVAEGAKMFDGLCKDSELRKCYTVWSGVMVTFQKELLKIMGTYARVRTAAKAFLKRYKEIKTLEGQPDAAFPQCLEIHLLVKFSEELRAQGVVLEAAWSSERKATAYRKMYKIVHDVVKKFNEPLAVSVLGDEDDGDDGDDANLFHDGADDVVPIPQDLLENPFEFITPPEIDSGIVRAYKARMKTPLEGLRVPFDIPKQNDMSKTAKFMKEVFKFWDKIKTVDECTHLRAVSAGGGVVAEDQKKGLATGCEGLRSGATLFLTGVLMKISTIQKDYPLQMNRVVGMGNGWCLMGEAGVDKWPFANSGGTAHFNFRFHPNSNVVLPTAVMCKDVGIHSPLLGLYTVVKVREPSVRVIDNAKAVAAAPPKTPSQHELDCSTQRVDRRKQSKWRSVIISIPSPPPPLPLPPFPPPSPSPPSHPGWFG